jgi:hypothetical protein
VPERVNAAHRVDQVLSRAAQVSSAQETLSAWVETLRINETDPQITARQALAVEVARKVGLLREQVQEVHRKMSDTSVRPQRYENAVQNVLNALDITGLTTSWQSYSQYLTPETLAAIGWCADTLPGEEEVIDEEELKALSREVDELWASVVERDLPDYVKSFLFEQVNIIRRAIKDYPIVGARAFKRSRVEAYVNLAENENTYREHQDEPEMQALRRLWGRVQTMAEKAGPWIAISQFAVRLGELMGGSL